MTRDTLASIAEPLTPEEANLVIMLERLAERWWTAPGMTSKAIFPDAEAFARAICDTRKLADEGLADGLREAWSAHVYEPISATDSRCRWTAPNPLGLYCKAPADNYSHVASTRKLADEGLAGGLREALETILDICKPMSMSMSGPVWFDGGTPAGGGSRERIWRICDAALAALDANVEDAG